MLAARVAMVGSVLMSASGVLVLALALLLTRKGMLLLLVLLLQATKQKLPHEERAICSILMGGSHLGQMTFTALSSVPSNVR
jgi:hypothetical protein